MTDIGTGSYTVIGQTAAEMMGVPLDKSSSVRRFGFSCLSGSGGQWGANSSTSGVYALAMLREAVAQKLGFKLRRHSVADGQVRSGNRGFFARRGRRRKRIVAEDAIEFGDLREVPAIDLGSHFVEVGVDVATAEIRVRRMLRVCRGTHPQSQVGTQPVIGA